MANEFVARNGVIAQNNSIVSGSLIVTGGITGSLFGTSSNAVSSSYSLSSSYSVNSSNAVSASYSLSGSYVVSASYSLSGSFAQTASYALNVPATASYAITSSYPISVSGSTIYSTGPTAGLGFSTNDSILLGSLAGFQSTNASQSIFLGLGAGYQATNGENSIFLGNNAGDTATNAKFSTFIGSYAGAGSSNASYSTLIGYRAGLNGGTSIGSNNIVIGTNITLPAGVQNAINLGGLIFGTGSYSDPNSSPFSGTSNGKVGINQPNPQYGLDVSGSGNYTNGLVVTGSLIAPNITGSLFGTASWAQNALTASYFITSSVTSASFATSASYSLSSSFAATASIATSATRASTVSISGISTDAEYSFPLILTGSSGPSIGLNNDTVSGFSYNPSTNLFKIFNLQGTGSLLGTSSYASQALSSSFSTTAATASYFLTSSVTSASFSTSASYALSSSFATSASYALSSSFATSASYSLSSSFATQAANATTASYILNAVSSSYATNAGNAYAVDVYVFGSDVESYLLMSNAAGTTGVAVGADTDLKYNSSTNRLSVGSVSATSLTGSLLGTASYASQALSSSFAISAATASYFITSSVTSASYAATASSADNFLVRQNLTASNALINGTITAQTLVVSTVSSSVVYSSGSNIFGNATSNVQQFTGSLRVSGSGDHYILGGSVGIGTTNIGTEANLVLGARGTSEGGQIILQKGTSYGSSSMLDNYQDAFRVLTGTDTVSSRMDLELSHVTQNLRIFGDVIAFAASDKRFKENIKPIENALDKIDQIGGYEFDWDDQVNVHGHEGHDIGVIAQEIEAILPEVVTTRDNGYKAVKYEKIVPLLIQAIKEQQKEIDELKEIVKNKL